MINKAVALDETTADALLASAEDGTNDIDPQCDFYLRNASYRIWPEADNLVLYPEFNQAQSSCQKPYRLPTEEAARD